MMHKPKPFCFSKEYMFYRRGSDAAFFMPSAAVANKGRALAG
jgi:hypothetical protein